MLREGLVSTVIPVFNRAGLLREAVASVLAQTYRPIEIIIVDDGSTDDTVEAIAALEREHAEIRALRIPNSGPGAAREAGRQAAAGEFIQYLDSDDLLAPSKFAVQAGFLRSNPEYDVSYGVTRFYAIGETPRDQPWKRTGEQIDRMFPAFLESRWWDTSTPLYRRSVLDRAGPWRSLRNEEDWEYDCRVASLGGRLHNAGAVVSDTRVHPGAMLSRHGATAAALRDRAAVRALIFEHARANGISEHVPEMRHFARAAFLLARQCGAAGLTEEARTLFELAKTASGPERARGIDFRLFGAAAGVVGWTAAARVSAKLDELRR